MNEWGSAGVIEVPVVNRAQRGAQEQFWGFRPPALTTRDEHTAGGAAEGRTAAQHYGGFRPIDQPRRRAGSTPFQ